MPLIPSSLESNIKNQLEPLITEHTQQAFYKAMEKFSEIASTQTGNTGKDIFSVANQEASVVFSNEMKNLAKDIASVVSINVDIYIKSATIIVPPGQAVTAPPPAGVGTTTSPSAPATIS
jgi:hypothetical protein